MAEFEPSSSQLNFEIKENRSSSKKVDNERLLTSGVEEIQFTTERSIKYSSKCIVLIFQMLFGTEIAETRKFGAGSN